MIHEHPNGGFHRIENRTELGLIPATKRLLEKARLLNNPRLDHVLHISTTERMLRLVK